MIPDQDRAHPVADFPGSSGIGRNPVVSVASRSPNQNNMHNAAALCAEGNRLLESGDSDRAIDVYHCALRFTTSHGPILNNLGNAYHQRGEFEKALEYYLAAQLAYPDSAQVLSHLGVVLMALRHLDAADRCFAEALRIQPDSPNAHWHRGLLRLLRGEMPSGWDGYEWRWRVGRFSAHAPRYSAQAWRGERLDDHHILLFAEQGFGDALQFLRYVPAIRALGAEVTLAVPVALRRLVVESFPGSGVIVEGDKVPASVTRQSSLMSLPAQFRTTLTSIPGHVPYLVAESGRVHTWAERLSSQIGRRIGLVWAGNPRLHDASANSIDRRRSLGLHSLLPLGDLSGVSWISLQVGEAANEATSWSGMLDPSNSLVDFAETAALVTNLDLVITVDTAVAHLAGALGKPVWLLSRFDGCWRWLLDRADSPWYPTMRIFRQPRSGDWNAVVSQVRAELRRELEDGRLGSF